MAALTQDKIDSIVKAYRDDPSATLNSVADAEEVSWATVKKYVEAAGVPIRGEGGQSDEDLGIETADQAPDIQALLQTPEAQDAIARAVAAHLAAAGAQTAPVPQTPATTGAPEWEQFMKQMEKFTESVNVQKPGYQKPLTASELQSREEGKDTFFALLRQVRLDIAEHGKQRAANMGLIPHYVVGEGGYYGSTAQGETLFGPGTHIYLTTPPPEDFLPINDTAAKIMRAQLQWLGEPTPPIEELVAQTMMRVRGGPDSIDVVGGDGPIHNDDASIVPGHDMVQVGAKRTFGTGVPELKATDQPLSPGADARAKGPVFVN